MPCSTTQLTSEAARNSLALSERLTGQTTSRQRAGLEVVQHRDVRVWPAHSSSIQPSPLEGLQPPALFFRERAELGDGVSVTEVAASSTKTVKQTRLASA